MKMNVSTAMTLNRMLNTINLGNVPELSKRIVKVCMKIAPKASEYESAISKLREDAKGKEEEEIKNLVSLKTVEEIAKEAIDIDVKFSEEEVTKIVENLYTISSFVNMERNVGDYMFLFSVLSEDSEEESK